MQKHTWRFSTIGGEKRVNIDTGSDLLHLAELDQKLWTALSCPVNGLEIDPRTLELIDTDHDGNVKVTEILNAIKWITDVLHNADDLIHPQAALPLSAINAGTDEGAKLLRSAKSILAVLGKPDADCISADDTADAHRLFAESKFNGDGIITPVSTNDAGIAECIQHVMQITGTVTDRIGVAGINRELTDAFFNSVSEYLTWHSEFESTQPISPLQEKTHMAYACYAAVKQKISDYFLRCELAAYQPALNSTLSDITNQVADFSGSSLPQHIETIAHYPLSTVLSANGLNMHTGINPAWKNALDEFYTHSVMPICGKLETLSENDWNKITLYFNAYQQWLERKKGGKVENLGLTYLTQLANSNSHQQIIQLIEQDISAGAEADYIFKVDQLVRYYRDLYKLLKNFVTFYDFYSSSDSIFQAGTLYIDQRSCNLCVRVHDMSKHNAMVSFSGMYMIYCECVSKKTNETIIIAAAFTNGDIDNLVVGRNALFYDKSGNDWQATVIKIIDNPISIKQAFWSPYRKVSRFIETQINKFAAEQDTKSQTSMQKGVEEMPVKNTDTETAQPKPAAPFDIGKFVGIFAAIGLAVGAIGSFIASFISGLLGLVWWKLPFAIAGILLVISGPSMIMAYFKLRKRNLAPILDANGWAINANVIINIPFGNTLTHEAKLPDGAQVNLNDPFMTRKFPYKWVLIGMLVLTLLVFYVVWKLGYMHLPEWSGADSVKVPAKDSIQ